MSFSLFGKSSGSFDFAFDLVGQMVIPAFVIGPDRKVLAWNEACEELTGLKATLPNGSIILYNGYVSLNQTPSFTKGQLMVVKATFSLQGLPIRYAS